MVVVEIVVATGDAQDALGQEGVLERQWKPTSTANANAQDALGQEGALGVGDEE